MKIAIIFAAIVMFFICLFAIYYVSVKDAQTTSFGLEEQGLETLKNEDILIERFKSGDVNAAIELAQAYGLLNEKQKRLEVLREALRLNDDNNKLQIELLNDLMNNLYRQVIEGEEVNIKIEQEAFLLVQALRKDEPDKWTAYWNEYTRLKQKCLKANCRPKIIEM